MSELQFELQPSLFHALAPKYVKRVSTFLLAGIPVYYLLMWISSMGFIELVRWRVIAAIILVAFFIGGGHIKLEAIKLHYTKYLFYDTHIVIQRKIVRAKRHSVPLGMIMKITNDHEVWDRMTKTSDIILHTQSEEKDFVLKSIKHPGEVEDKIYKLLKSAPQNHSNSHSQSKHYV